MGKESGAGNTEPGKPAQEPGDRDVNQFQGKL